MRITTCLMSRMSPCRRGLAALAGGLACALAAGATVAIAAAPVTAAAPPMKVLRDSSGMGTEPPVPLGGRGRNETTGAAQRLRDIELNAGRIDQGRWPDSGPEHRSAQPAGQATARAVGCRYAR